MMLEEMLKGCDYAERYPDDGTFMNREVLGVAYDSRKVVEGYLFVAIKGERYDGHDFIKDAVGRGAIAVVHNHEISGYGIGNSEINSPIVKPGSTVCFISVKDSKRALACISNNFYGRPTENLTLIGVTGTNGKTTTTYILKSILESWRKNVGLIGTIQYMIKDRAYPAPHTTPESLEFQGLLRSMALSGCTHVVAEVSSHALTQYRVDGAVFQAAVFTNLTRDHLDFHKTMEDYFRAKERLFLELLDEAGTAVINLDDPFGKKLNSALRELRPGLRILTYGLETGADIVADEIEASFEGLRLVLSFRGRNYPISSKLTGMPNVYNIMSAVGASISLNIPWQAILNGIDNMDNITGRFEKIDAGQKFICVIDYAHTEDALERLITTAREIVKEKAGKQSPHYPPLLKGGLSPRIITVFGCGGDRDRGKRPKMGDVATNLSDYVIITSDNPRSEDPMDIIKDIVTGVKTGNYLIEPDRREAIRKAVEKAEDGDIILVAGKGHEDYQEIKGERHPFRDRDVVKEAIKNRLRNSGCRRTDG